MTEIFTNRGVDIKAHFFYFRALPWELEEINFKSFKFHKRKSYLCFLNSCEIWNLFFFGLP